MQSYCISIFQLLLWITYFQNISAIAPSDNAQQETYDIINNIKTLLITDIDDTQSNTIPEVDEKYDAPQETCDIINNNNKITDIRDDKTNDIINKIKKLSVIHDDTHSYILNVDEKYEKENDGFKFKWQEVDFQWQEVHTSKLDPGQVAHVYWKSNIDVPITQNIYRIGLLPELRHALLDYISTMGILSKFDSMMIHDKSQELDVGSDSNVIFQYERWLIQRPPEPWHSNMHWISPNDEHAQQSYLRALAKGKFDYTLEAIGQHLALDGLFVYQLTFIGVNHCTEGFRHQDLFGTNAKAYNLIVPLILVPGSNPELDVFGTTLNDDLAYGNYQYQYEEGIMLGDDADHATSAVDYIESGRMRVMATIYLADISAANVDAVMEHYTQNYPPLDTSYLLTQQGKHWKPKSHDQQPSALTNDGYGQLPRESIWMKVGLLKLRLMTSFYLEYIWIWMGDLVG